MGQLICTQTSHLNKHWVREEGESWKETWLAIVIALAVASPSTSSGRHSSWPSGPVILSFIIFSDCCGRILRHSQLYDSGLVVSVSDTTKFK